MLSEDGRKPVKPKSCQTRPKQALISSLKGRSNPQWMRHAEKHDNTCPIEAQTMSESARLARNRRWTGNDSGKNGGLYSGFVSREPSSRNLSGSQIGHCQP